PDGGLIIFRDGDPGEPETLLSPVSYYWQHRALVEAVVQKGDQAARDLALDSLYRKISIAIAGDRTLGGLCDRVTPQAPDSNVLVVEGSPQIKGAIIPLEIIYVTADPLG
ncbi:MAG: acyl-CoA transferase, partial [Bdellovibrionales bacterium]